MTRRSLVALIAAGLAARPLAHAAEPVKHLVPAQYLSRVVAPRKGRVLVVNFWATWCEPCREEMPGLVAASRGYPAKDLAVVLVSLDTQKAGPREVPKFLEKLKIPFVCWLARSHDPQDFIDAVDKTWNGALPYTLVYGRDGQIAAKLAGMQTEASFGDAIRKAAAKAP